MGPSGVPLCQKAQRTLRRARGEGLEPSITGPEPAVLPITPPPNGWTFRLAERPRADSSAAVTRGARWKRPLADANVMRPPGSPGGNECGFGGYASMSRWSACWSLSPAIDLACGRGDRLPPSSAAVLTCGSPPGRPRHPGRVATGTAGLSIQGDPGPQPGQRPGRHGVSGHAGLTCTDVAARTVTWFATECRTAARRTRPYEPDDLDTPHCNVGRRPGRLGSATTGRSRPSSGSAAGSSVTATAAPPATPPASSASAR